MSVEAYLKQAAGQQAYTPSAAVDAGEVVQLNDGRAGVCVTDIAASALGAVYTAGIFDITSASSTTFTAGDPVYWDASASVAIDTPATADDIYLGTAVVAKVSGDLVVTTDLNANGATGGLPVFGTRPVTFDHADTASYTILNAAQNPNGHVIVASFGKITEACAGGTEDQLVVTLYDSDDNALSVLTVSNAGADSVGDVIVGTRTPTAGSTGDALALVPAGKGLYAKISQATSGTGVAGAMQVKALLAAVV